MKRLLLFSLLIGLALGQKPLPSPVVAGTGGGGGGCTPAGSANQVLVDDGAGDCTATGVTISSNNISTPGTVTSGVGGAVAGALDLGQGTSPAVGSNVFGWGAPTTMTTSVRLTSPNAVPSANNVMLFGAPSSNVATWTWTGISGSGSFCMSTSCVMTTPTLGVASATTINKVALTAPATGSTLTIADGKTLTASNTLTFTGTDSSSVAFGAGGTVTYTIASGTKALDTDAIASTACDTLTTTTATGAASTDVLIITPNADITAVTGYAPVTTGGLQVFYWLTTNTINWKICNPTSSSITPGAVTLNYRIVR